MTAPSLLVGGKREMKPGAGTPFDQIVASKVSVALGEPRKHRRAEQKQHSACKSGLFTLGQSCTPSGMTPHERPSNIADGYCHCGCGERTKLAPKTSARRGWIKGQPMRFVAHHHTRSSMRPKRERPRAPRTRRQWNISIEDRGFISPCHMWTGPVDADGYGYFSLHGTNRRAHRVAYEAAYGTIPPGLVICHRCDNPGCVNAEHLFAGTHQENMADMQAKGRGRGRGRRLSSDTIAGIREALQTQSHQEVAAAFGVSRRTVQRVKNSIGFENRLPGVPREQKVRGWRAERNVHNVGLELQALEAVSLASQIDGWCQLVAIPDGIPHQRLQGLATRGFLNYEPPGWWSLTSAGCKRIAELEALGYSQYPSATADTEPKTTNSTDRADAVRVSALQTIRRAGNGV